MIGTELNGVYRIDAKIAEGGMGTVFRGHNIHSGETVAIKTILPEFAANEAHLALFRREAMLLHQFTHPAIVRYYMFAVDPTRSLPYFAMEFVDGVSLSDRVAAGPLSTGDARQVALRVAGGLASAHAIGIVHRDMSPDNIILPDNRVEAAKIIDFGIARASQVKGGTVLEGAFAGRYSYASPEQLGLAGGEVTPQSDLYSLGLVVAAMLRGEAIDMGETHAELIERRLAVPDLAGIDETMRPLLTRMLQPKPGDRPAGMAEVVEALTDMGPLPETTGLPGDAGHPTAASSSSSSPLERTEIAEGPVGGSWRGGNSASQARSSAFGSRIEATEIPPDLRERVSIADAAGGASFSGEPPAAWSGARIGTILAVISLIVVAGVVSTYHAIQSDLLTADPSPQEMAYTGGENGGAANRPSLTSDNQSPPEPASNDTATDSTPAVQDAANTAALADQAADAAPGVPLADEIVQTLGIDSAGSAPDASSAEEAGQTSPAPPNGDQLASAEPDSQPTKAPEPDAEGNAPSGTAGSAMVAGQPETPTTPESPTTDTQATSPPPGTTLSADATSEPDPSSGAPATPKAEPAATDAGTSSPEATAGTDVAAIPLPSTVFDVVGQVQDPCFYARVTRASVDASTIEAFGAAIDPAARLNDDVLQVTGVEPNIGMRLVSEAQCPLVDFLSQHADRANGALSLKLDSDVVSSRQPLSGKVQGLYGTRLHLILVDEDGAAHDLTHLLEAQANDAATFRIDLSGGASAKAVPLILLLLSTSDSVDFDAAALKGSADSVVPALQDAMTASGSDAHWEAAYLKFAP
ncbi:Serine/threonine-protein kinase PrkC [Hartmannibacter diazotrophicus]|uniref:Serine/threonine-protein kinase PrkC n=1 Tax=Hartmannibacter diazotrophicus TaxID=1482074 RepID=A0A2C9D375_9HYPH|nr:serine/threonine-protein kinase [Hartmannibacter diazotrophicus]SON53925.1 Serine/threonine-protein kinase PrkC [Hartmannibacter diazotrophicus]